MLLDNKYTDIHTHRLPPPENSVFSFRSGIGEKVPHTELISVGIHPWDAGVADSDQFLSDIRESNPVAIGETGLDYNVGVDRTIQKSTLRLQLEIASETGLPVILHCVKAYEDLIKIISDYDLKAKILHGYIGSGQLTRGLISYGFSFSIGDRSLRSPKTVESLGLIPPDQLFFETDESETGIKEIYSQAAFILGLSPDELANRTADNFNRIFR